MPSVHLQAQTHAFHGDDVGGELNLQQWLASLLFFEERHGCGLRLRFIDELWDATPWNACPVGPEEETDVCGMRVLEYIHKLRGDNWVPSPGSLTTFTVYLFRHAQPARKNCVLRGCKQLSSCACPLTLKNQQDDQAASHHLSSLSCGSWLACVCALARACKREQAPALMRIRTSLCT